jgi:hypothetical protein
MLDFKNVDEKEFAELKQMVQKSTEKSDLDRFPLFSTDKEVKAKLFILCYRFLLNANNLLLEGTLKDELKKEIKFLAESYNKINTYINFLESNRKYGRHLVVDRLFDEVNNTAVTDLIDVFSVLTERVNIIPISRFKGVVLEGKSGDDFNKIMASEAEPFIEPEVESSKEE